MSNRYGPSPRAMNSGSPPTAPKARAGLLTPPGIRRPARWNASRLRARCGFIVVVLGVAGMKSSPGGLHEQVAGLVHLRLQGRVVAVEGDEVEARGPGVDPARHQFRLRGFDRPRHQLLALLLGLFGAAAALLLDLLRLAGGEQEPGALARLVGLLLQLLEAALGHVQVA